MNNFAQKLEAMLRNAAGCERKLKLWCRLSLAWAVAALLAGGLLAIGWRSPGSLLLVLLVTFAGAAWAWRSSVLRISNQTREALRSLALRIERTFPELDGR